MSIRKHGKGYQVRLRGHRARTFNTGNPAADKKAAKRYEAQLLQADAGADLYPAAPETVGQALAATLRRRKAKRAQRDSTVKRHTETKKKLDPFKNVPLAALTAERVELWLEDMAATPNQAQKALSLLKAVLRDAQGRNQRFDRAILAIEPPRYDVRVGRFLTLEEVEQIGSWMPEFVRRIVPVAALTGLRQGELFDLTESDVDLTSSTLTVRRSKTKAGEGRRVDLVPLAVRLLREQLVARSRTHNSRAVMSLVFPTPTGLRWDKDRFMHRYFRPAAKAAKLEGVVFHDLRHSYASLAIRAGVNDYVIAEQLGHADARLVRSRYGHLRGDEGKVAAALLDALIETEARGA